MNCDRTTTATREARDAKTEEPSDRAAILATPTVQQPRPSPRPLPAAWREEAGMLVHTSGAHLEPIDQCTDAELAETEAFAADVISLCQWRRRERVIARRWSPGPSGSGGGEAA